jgi:uncharacterized caspase-like protein
MFLTLPARTLCSRLLSMGLLALALGAPPAEAAEGAVPPAVDPALRTGEKAPKDIALVIGNEGYATLPQFDRGMDDARAMRDWLQNSRGVNKKAIYALQDANREAILKEAKKAAGKVKSGGTVWIYFAGHGATGEDGKRMLLGADAGAGNLAARGVRLEELTDLFLKPRKAERVIVILDAGFGNTGRDGLELIPGRTVKAPAPLGPTDERLTVWLASQDDQPAWLYPPARHGLFTWSVLGALRGWADGELDGERDARVSLDEAQALVARTVTALGRPAAPSTERRPDPAGWVLVQGKGLEGGPTAAALDQLGREDLSRRRAEVEQRVRQEAAAFWADTQAMANTGSNEGRAALEAYIAEFGNARVTLSWALPIAEVAEARRKLATYGMTAVAAVTAPPPERVVTPPPPERVVTPPPPERVVTPPPPERVVTPPPPERVVAPPPPVLARVETAPADGCGDLIALEPMAMMGQLSGPQKGCIESRLKLERTQTSRNKLSRMLISNAEAAGDSTGWAALVARHLDAIDRSDPNMCMRYAIYLHKTNDVENAEESIRWADYALENKQAWEGEEYTKRVSGLYRLRAEAAGRLWKDAEERFSNDGLPESDAAAKQHRSATKDYAREWLDYARAARLPTDGAYNLCASAAGTASACKEGAAP